MPVVPWKGPPPFGGKTIIVPGSIRLPTGGAVAVGPAGKADSPAVDADSPDDHAASDDELPGSG